MSSTNKTNALGLNKWIDSDKPKMADFNQDNEIIDGVISEHLTDEIVHITDAERSQWNNYMHFQVYYGQGNGTQNVELTCDFEPRACLVFGMEYPMGASDFTNGAHYNYFGIATTTGNMFGLDLNGKTLSVTKSTVSTLATEYTQYNQKAVSYIVIALR